MVFKNLCVIVLLMKVALALEGLKICKRNRILVYILGVNIAHCIEFALYIQIELLLIRESLFIYESIKLNIMRMC